MHAENMVASDTDGKGAGRQENRTEKGGDGGATEGKGGSKEWLLIKYP